MLLPKNRIGGHKNAIKEGKKMKKDKERAAAVLILINIQKEFSKNNTKVDLWWKSEPYEDGDGITIGWYWQSYSFQRVSFG